MPIVNEKPIYAEYAVTNAVLITMDEDRTVYKNGAFAVSKGRIVWLGHANDLDASVITKRVVDYTDHVIAPGFINSHVHVTGDPMTRHYMPDYQNDPDKLMKWVIPRYTTHSAEDEKVSATFCALELLKSGTTTFVEAGTIRHLDAVVDGLNATGIRGRVGAWVEGRDFGNTSDSSALEATAIKTLHAQNAKYPSSDKALISAWPILIGHNTNSDAVWQAAKQIADENTVRVTAHMSPYNNDVEWYLENTGRRPVEHLDYLGVLGENVFLTHATHLDDKEVEIMARTGTHVAFCPFATLKGAFGASKHGNYIAMLNAGVQFSLATDGYDCDILTGARLGASLLKDWAEDVSSVSALRALEMITCEAAIVLGLDDDIGALSIGKKADFVCFDANHFQWFPMLSPIDQLLWSADVRSIRDVWVDGEKVIANGVSTRVDEGKLLKEVQRRAESLIKRAGLPFHRNWKTVD